MTSLIPPSIDLFHDRALQERSANTRHERAHASLRRAKPYPSVERPVSIRTDPSVQLYRGTVHGIHDQRSPNKQKLLPFDKEQVFQQLWMHLWACKSFAKYRHDQRKTQRRAKDQIWTDRNEFLFFRALVEFWPTGRVQQVDERFMPKKNSGKAEFGRNELIALWMDQHMAQHVGQKILRKVISSHLQVTKAKIKSELIPDPYVLYWLGGLGSENDQRRYAGNPSWLVPSRVQREQHILEPVQFGIRIRETDAFGRVDKTVHTIAYSTNAAKREDQYLAAMPVWRREYPHLSQILDDAHLWGVEIMLVGCPLSVINGADLRSIRSKAGSNNCDVDLSIQNKFRFKGHVPASEEWTCDTTFFQRGEVVGQVKHPHPAPIHTDALHTHWDGKYQTLMVPFKSDYWLSMICGFAERIDTGDSESVEQDVEDMLAVQEIRTRPRSTDKDDLDGRGDDYEPGSWTTLLVLLWNFHVDSSPQPAETTWRSVFLPFEQLQASKPDISKTATANDLDPMASEQPDYAELGSADGLQPRSLPAFDAHDAVFDLDLASVPFDAQHYRHASGRSSLPQSSMHAGGMYDYNATFGSPLGLDFSGPTTSISEQAQHHNGHAYDHDMFGAGLGSLTWPSVMDDHRQDQPDAASAGTHMSTQPSQDSIFSHLARTDSTSHTDVFSTGESDPSQFTFSVPFTAFAGYAADAGAPSAFSQPGTWLQQAFPAPTQGKALKSAFEYEPPASSLSFADYASPASSHSETVADDVVSRNPFLQQLVQSQRVLPPGTSPTSPTDCGRHFAYPPPSQHVTSVPLPSAVLPSQPASAFPLPPADEDDRHRHHRRHAPAPRRSGPRMLQPRTTAAATVSNKQQQPQQRETATASHDALVTIEHDAADHHHDGADDDDDDDDDNNGNGVGREQQQGERAHKRRRLLASP